MISPGKWLVGFECQQDNDDWAEHSENAPITADGVVIAEVYPETELIDGNWDNAQLIAAAPELLAACRVAIDWLADKGVPIDHPEAVKIRAAIAKAGG